MFWMYFAFTVSPRIPFTIRTRRSSKESGGSRAVTSGHGTIQKSSIQRMSNSSALFVFVDPRLGTNCTPEMINRYDLDKIPWSKKVPAMVIRHATTCPRSRSWELILSELTGSTIRKFCSRFELNFGKSSSNHESRCWCQIQSISLG